MNKTKVAICCPVYNCIEYTKEFIGSIVSRHPVKIFIHDNGSKDGVYEWMKDLVLPGKEISVSHSDENLGISKGANIALKNAMEDPEITHIIYSNNDVVFRKETVDSLVWAWKNRLDKRIVRISGPDVRVGNWESKERCWKYISEYASKDHLNLIYGGSYTCFIMDKEAFEKVGLLDENVDYYDDNIHAEEILRRGFVSVTFFPALYMHYGSGTMQMNKEDNSYFRIKFDQDQKYAFKYFGVETQAGIREITDSRIPDWKDIIKDTENHYKEIYKGEF